MHHQYQCSHDFNLLILRQQISLFFSDEARTSNVEVMAASSSFERIPVLEMSEREEVWSGGQQHKMYQAYKGVLINM